jgi:hypothetical protein
VNGNFEWWSLIDHGVPEWAINNDPLAIMDLTKPKPEHILQRKAQKDDEKEDRTNSDPDPTPKRKGK